MDSITLIFTGASTREWRAPADVRLVGSQATTTGGSVISWDPGATWALFTAALADGLDTNVIWIPTMTGSVIFPEPVPILGGRSIFVASSGKLSVTLFYLPA